MCNLTRTAIWLNLVVRLICSIWRRRQSDKLAAKAIWCLSGNQSHVARKLPAPNASDQSQQRGPDQIARLRRAGLGPDWGQIGVCQSGNLAIRRRFCRIAFDWPADPTKRPAIASGISMLYGSSMQTIPCSLMPGARRSSNSCIAWEGREGNMDLFSIGISWSQCQCDARTPYGRRTGH